jgi:hypothetical protein
VQASRPRITGFRRTRTTLGPIAEVDGGDQLDEVHYRPRRGHAEKLGYPPLADSHSLRSA